MATNLSRTTISCSKLMLEVCFIFYLMTSVDVCVLTLPLVHLNNFSWKETKNFENGCSAHITGSSYAEGNVALPDQATFIIENTHFGNSVSLEASHHCGVGSTGGLCQPTYILDNVKWTNRDTFTIHAFTSFRSPSLPDIIQFKAVLGSCFLVKL